MTRTTKSGMGILVAVATLFVGSGTVGAQPSGGQIKAWGVVEVTSSANKPSPVVITGAIADYGKTLAVNSSGKPDENGNTVKVTLKKGSFKVDVSQLNAAFNSAQPSDFNSANCSGSITVGPVPVPVEGGSGTGSYTGISGSLEMTSRMAVILPRSKKGSCNTANNANPVAGWGEITGTGSVSFS